LLDVGDFCFGNAIGAPAVKTDENYVFGFSLSIAGKKRGMPLPE
jgi:hypothetical protein